MTEQNLHMIPAWINDTFQPVEKLKAHIDGLKHLAISVFVISGNQVLLQKRAAGKYHTPGLWANTCCTHPHWEEAPLECAHRRLDEELGITGLMLQHCGQVEYRADVGGGLTEHEVVDIYRADASKDLALSLNPDEVEATRWIEIDALMQEVVERPEIFTPWLRIYLEKHWSKIFG